MKYQATWWNMSAEVQKNGPGFLQVAGALPRNHYVCGRNLRSDGPWRLDCAYLNMEQNSIRNLNGE